MTHGTVPSRPEFEVPLDRSVNRASTLTPVPDSRPGDVPTPSSTQLGLCRRLRMALYDLGLLSITGESWATPAGEGMGFADLPFGSPITSSAEWKI